VCSRVRVRLRRLAFAYRENVTGSSLSLSLRMLMTSLGLIPTDTMERLTLAFWARATLRVGPPLQEFVAININESGPLTLLPVLQECQEIKSKVSHVFTPLLKSKRKYKLLFLLLPPRANKIPVGNYLLHLRRRGHLAKVNTLERLFLLCFVSLKQSEELE
jgi:hypothetical protein